ncbi:hypothetical protein AMTR_s00060p00124060 [Amborella trichopoda]|uniref:Uncharacterized protein n=1 Tax=Amborella trichopoda TaxID=13333 RepID=W1NKU8_AMBTC|nr:hypothetical protein AMTR_s00060p00124060 [Amborella trichopoda]
MVVHICCGGKRSARSLPVDFPHLNWKIAALKCPLNCLTNTLFSRLRVQHFVFEALVPLDPAWPFTSSGSIRGLSTPPAIMTFVMLLPKVTLDRIGCQLMSMRGRLGSRGDLTTNVWLKIRLKRRPDHWPMDIIHRFGQVRLKKRLDCCPMDTICGSGQDRLKR